MKMSVVLQGFLKTVGVEGARGVNPYGNGRYILTTKTAHAAELLMEQGHLEVAARAVPLTPLTQKTKVVTVHFLPVEVHDEDLRAVLSCYGEVVSLRRDYFLEAPSVEKGTR